jgi:hypothetical protein
MPWHSKARPGPCSRWAESYCPPATQVASAFSLPALGTCRCQMQEQRVGGSLMIMMQYSGEAQRKVHGPSRGWLRMRPMHLGKRSHHATGTKRGAGMGMGMGIGMSKLLDEQCFHYQIIGELGIGSRYVLANIEWPTIAVVLPSTSTATNVECIVLPLEGDIQY